MWHELRITISASRFTFGTPAPETQRPRLDHEDRIPPLQNVDHEMEEPFGDLFTSLIPYTTMAEVKNLKYFADGVSKLAGSTQDQIRDLHGLADVRSLSHCIFGSVLILRDRWVRVA